MKQNRQGCLWVAYNEFLKVCNAAEITKGQIISECLFDFLNFPKNQRKI